jgi:hypothetical protein
VSTTKLKLRPISGTQNFQHGDHTYQYEVDGLPLGERASIAEDGVSHRWQILRTKDGVQGNWTGDYETAVDALAALQEEF